jgi:ubiquitin C-terminal hydrolase
MPLPLQVQQDREGPHPVRGLLLALAAEKPDRLQPHARKPLPTQFKGDKQHDANDFLLNFVNTLNDHLKKEEDKAYNSILDPFVGEFYSKVLCPNCNGVSENNEIFLQISLPVKTRVVVKAFLYTVVESLAQIRRGKARMSDNWKEIKADVDAKTSLVCLMR